MPLNRFDKAVLKGKYKVAKRMLNGRNLIISDSVETLLLAIDSASLAMVNLILDQVPVNIAYDNYHVVCLAAGNGSLDIVKRLLQIDSLELCASEHGYAWCAAVENDHIEIAMLLLQDKRIIICSDEGEWSLYYAAEKGYTEIVKLLLRTEIDPSENDNQALCIAAQKGNIDIVKLLLTDTRVNPFDFNNCAIHAAMAHGHDDIVRIFMLDHRFDIDCYVNGVFYRAVATGDINIVKKLLNDDRVDPNLHGNTYYPAFVMAVENGHLEMVDLLCNSNRIDLNTMALARQTAAKNNNRAMLTILLRDPELPDKGVMNALREAAHCGHIDIVKWLLQDFRNNISTIRAPLACAVQNSHLAVVEALLASPIKPETDLKSAFECCQCPHILDRLLRASPKIFKINCKNKAMRTILWQERQARLGHVNKHHLAAIADFGLSRLVTANIYSFLAAPRDTQHQQLHTNAVYSALQCINSTT